MQKQREDWLTDLRRPAKNYKIAPIKADCRALSEINFGRHSLQPLNCAIESLFSVDMFLAHCAVGLFPERSRFIIDPSLALVGEIRLLPHMYFILSQFCNLTSYRIICEEYVIGLDHGRHRCEVLWGPHLQKVFWSKVRRHYCWTNTIDGDPIGCEHWCG